LLAINLEILPTEPAALRPIIGKNHHPADLSLGRIVQRFPNGHDGE
jgi:hypothetical protein